MFISPLNTKPASLCDINSYGALRFPSACIFDPFPKVLKITKTVTITCLTQYVLLQYLHASIFFLKRFRVISFTLVWLEGVQTLRYVLVIPVIILIWLKLLVSVAKLRNLFSYYNLCAIFPLKNFQFFNPWIVSGQYTVCSGGLVDHICFVPIAISLFCRHLYCLTSVGYRVT